MVDESEKKRGLSDAAKRALKEAEERRAKTLAKEAPPETAGPKGPDPVRYGDWEKDGITSDF